MSVHSLKHLQHFFKKEQSQQGPHLQLQQSLQSGQENPEQHLQQAILGKT